MYIEMVTSLLCLFGISLIHSFRLKARSEYESAECTGFRPPSLNLKKLTSGWSSGVKKGGEGGGADRPG